MIPAYRGGVCRFGFMGKNPQAGLGANHRERRALVMAGFDMVGDFSSFVLLFILDLSKTRLSILVCKKKLKNLFFSLLFSAFALSFCLTICPYAEVGRRIYKTLFFANF